VVVGGTGAVGPEVVTAARAVAPSVTRIAGADRYATSAALARAAFGATGAATAYIVTGRGFADALAAGPAAGAGRSPVVLVDGRAASLSTSTRTLLRDLGASTATIVGGTGAVSTGVESDLRELLGTTVLATSSVTRAAGADRYATAIAVNRLAFPDLPAGDAYVATGLGFADALSVSVLAGRAKRPLYLSIPYCASTPLRSEITSTGATRVRLVGGPGAIRGLVGRLEPCRSIGAASSLWVVVNKKRSLNPLKYTPSPLVKPSISNLNGQSLRSDAAAALARLANGVEDAGAGRIAMLSGYRSYSYQSTLYANKVASAGRTEADRWVARPGYSEHQTGLGTDVSPVGAAGCSSYTCIGSTPQGRWIAANAWRYGFVVRYEKGQTSVTGYNAEPWHLRYVGTALARDYREGGWHSLEAYFGLPAAPTY
jgi:LAS superfamily LD-carboxypeptidase LdcB